MTAHHHEPKTRLSAQAKRKAEYKVRTNYPLLLQMVKPVCQGCTALTTGNEIFLYVGGKFPFPPSPLCRWKTNAALRGVKLQPLPRELNSI